MGRGGILPQLLQADEFGLAGFSRRYAASFQDPGWGFKL